MFDYQLEHIYTYNVKLEMPPEVIGPLPEGLRINVYITGGEVKGPRLNGKLRPVGGDWLTVRTDGVGMLDIRSTIETEDGAVIYAAYTGLADFGPDGYQKLLQGEPAPSGIPMRTMPRFNTAHPDYEWVNRVQGLAVGAAFMERAEAIFDVYAVR